MHFLKSGVNSRCLSTFYLSIGYQPLNEESTMKLVPVPVPTHDQLPAAPPIQQVPKRKASAALGGDDVTTNRTLLSASSDHTYSQLALPTTNSMVNPSGALTSSAAPVSRKRNTITSTTSPRAATLLGPGEFYLQAVFPAPPKLFKLSSSTKELE